MKLLLVSLSICLIVGCVQPIGRVNTPSGKPEITINRPAKIVKDFLVRNLANEGKVLSHVDEYRLATSYPGTDSKIILWLGAYDIEDNYTFTPIDSFSTKVFLARRLIGDPRFFSGQFVTAQEHYNDMMNQLLALFSQITKN